MADVIIVGAGPAGIFAALELTRKAPELDITIIEQGKDIHERGRSGHDVLEGWGGAGAFSDGKLTISTDVGGHLAGLISDEDLLAMQEYADGIYCSYADCGEMLNFSSVK